MALIGKIRSNMWLVFVIIALATLSFILMDAMGPGGGGFGGANANTPVGEIAGKKIKQQEFEAAYQTMFNNSSNTQANRAALWQYFVESGIVNNEAEKLGLNIGEEEMNDLQFGANLSPVIRRNFANPQTGQLDVAQLQQIKNQLETGGQINPQLTAFWKEQAKQIQKEQLQSKLGSLAQKAVYTPNWLAEAGYKEENATVDAAVVKIPFDNIPTGDITVTDADINSYMAKNKAQYNLDEEKRQVSYMTLNVVPSAADSARLTTEINQIIEGFRTTPNDSAYALANNGFYAPGYIKSAQIDEFYKEKLPTYELGQVYGPYELGGTYQGVKVIDKRSLPDSVKARHILRRVTVNNVEEAEEADRLIDSLYNVLSRNKRKFAELAEEFSQDASNASEGGDLGYFAQGRMVKEFNDVAFVTGKEGGLYKVRTQFGVHLVYIEDQKYVDRTPAYKLAYVSTPIIPSNETESATYSVMLDLINDYPYLSDLKTAVASNPDVTVANTANLGVNDYNIPALGANNTTRDLIKWAFKKGTKVNDVSPTIYEYTNPQYYYTDKYVVAGLDRIVAKGLPKAEDMRSTLEFAVLNDLKGQKAAAALANMDLSTAAGQYGVQVDTLSNINMLNNFVPGIGNEPTVLGAATGQAAGTTSAPIVGSSGVFVVKTLNKTEAGDVSTNLGSVKRTMANNKKSKLLAGLLPAMKKGYKIKDNRSTFY